MLVVSSEMQHPVCLLFSCPSPTNSRLGHVTGLGQWHVSKHAMNRDLIKNFNPGACPLWTLSLEVLSYLVKGSSHPDEEIRWRDR